LGPADRSFAGQPETASADSEVRPDPVPDPTPTPPQNLGSTAGSTIHTLPANSAIHALYSVAPRSYARDRVCLVGDAGAVFPPFTGSGVLKAVANATSLADALADAPAVDDALRRWSQAQLQVAGQVMQMAEDGERSQVFDMPDLAAMPTAATNDWMSSAYAGSGFVLTLPEV